MVSCYLGRVVVHACAMQLSFFEIEHTNGTASTWFNEILMSLGVAPGAPWPDQFGIALRNWLAKQSIPRIRTFSLFSGGGGLDIAFHDAGFDIVEMVEIDPRYVETLRENFAERSRVTCVDIRDFVPENGLQIDFVIGGPPCQTFSAAGRRAAGVVGTDDPRGMLFQEYIRLLTHFRPKGFLFENVYGITGAQNGNAWKEIQFAFKAAGYTIFFRVLDAADYGVPQHRERLFIVGVQDAEFLFPYPTHGPDSIGQEPYYSAGEAVKGTVTANATQGIGGRYGHLLHDIPPGLNYSFYTKEMGYPSPVFSWRSKFSDFLYKADPERPVRTIKAQGGQYTGPFSWDNRVFTISELKRLQTFPDSYEIVGGRQVSIEQIGNSVPPQIGRMLAISILDQVLGISLPFKMHYLPKTKALGFRQRKRALTEVYSLKAQKALGELQHNDRIIQINPSENTLGEPLTRFLGEDFSWKNERTPRSIEFCVSFAVDSTEWQVSVRRDGFDLEIQPSEGYNIEIYPANHGQWPLKPKIVKLHADQFDQRTFTALWKAFEENLLAMTGIADLVQLSGYYQYQSEIKAKLYIAGSNQLDPFWRIIQLITEGVGVGKQLPGSQLAMLWNCDINKLLDHLITLRSMGFEVRGHKTNSQIKTGDYLIPYIFPTFTPKSVQLRKSLRERHA